MKCSLKPASLQLHVLHHRPWVHLWQQDSCRGSAAYQRMFMVAGTEAKLPPFCGSLSRGFSTTGDVYKLEINLWSKVLSIDLKQWFTAFETGVTLSEALKSSWLTLCLEALNYKRLVCTTLQSRCVFRKRLEVFQDARKYSCRYFDFKTHGWFLSSAKNPKPLICNWLDMGALGLCQHRNTRAESGW